MHGLDDFAWVIVCEIKRWDLAKAFMTTWYDFPYGSEWVFSIEICGALGGTCVVIEMLVDIALNLEMRNQISFACLVSLFHGDEWLLE